MKNKPIGLFAGVILCFSFLLSACVDGKTTYYPDKNEMTINLQSKGYQTYSTNILLGEGTGTFLTGTKEEEYIKIYWLDNADDCEYYYNLLENSCPDCNVIAKLENDENFGNIVYCGTTNAVNDAGIKVVNGKVNVKV